MVTTARLFAPHAHNARRGGYSSSWPGDCRWGLRLRVAADVLAVHVHCPSPSPSPALVLCTAALCTAALCLGACVQQQAESGRRRRRTRNGRFSSRNTLSRAAPASPWRPVGRLATRQRETSRGRGPRVPVEPGAGLPFPLPLPLPLPQSASPPARQPSGRQERGVRSALVRAVPGNANIESQRCRLPVVGAAAVLPVAGWRRQLLIVPGDTPALALAGLADGHEEDEEDGQDEDGGDGAARRRSRSGQNAWLGSRRCCYCCYCCRCCCACAVMQVQVSSWSSCCWRTRSPSLTRSASKSMYSHRPL